MVPIHIATWKLDLEESSAETPRTCRKSEVAVGRRTLCISVSHRQNDRITMIFKEQEPGADWLEECVQKDH